MQIIGYNHSNKIQKSQEQTPAIQNLDLTKLGNYEKYVIYFPLLAYRPPRPFCPNRPRPAYFAHPVVPKNQIQHVILPT